MAARERKLVPFLKSCLDGGVHTDCLIYIDQNEQIFHVKLPRSGYQGIAHEEFLMAYVTCQQRSFRSYREEKDTFLTALRKSVFLLNLNIKRYEVPKYKFISDPSEYSSDEISVNSDNNEEEINLDNAVSPGAAEPAVLQLSSQSPTLQEESTASSFSSVQSAILSLEAMVSPLTSSQSPISQEDATASPFSDFQSSTLQSAAAVSPFNSFQLSVLQEDITGNDILQEISMLQDATDLLFSNFDSTSFPSEATTSSFNSSQSPILLEDATIVPLSNFQSTMLQTEAMVLPFNSLHLSNVQEDATDSFLSDIQATNLEPEATVSSFNSSQSPILQAEETNMDAAMIKIINNEQDLNIKDVVQAKCWEEVCLEINPGYLKLDVEDRKFVLKEFQTKWSFGEKTKFVREKKERETKSGDPARKEKKYAYYDHLLFLEPTLGHRPTARDVADSIIQGPSTSAAATSDFGPSATAAQKRSASNIAEIDGEDVDDEDKTPSGPFSRKRRKLDLEEVLARSLKRDEDEQRDDTQGNRHFVLSLIPYLQRFSPDANFRVRTRIMNVMQNAMAEFNSKVDGHEEGSYGA